MDLNKRYLNLTGIFEFNKDKVSINTIFTLILKHSKCNETLEKIAQNLISINVLYEYFEHKEFKEFFKTLGIKEPKDIKTYKQNLDKEKLKNFLNTQFKKEYILLKF